MNLRETAGIYQIINKQNLKCYIGSTTRNFYSRFYDHKRYLKNNKHHNQYLQNAWNKYGEDVFEFEVLETIDKSLDKIVFLEKEYYWITKFDSANSEFGYNAVTNPSETTKDKYKHKKRNRIYHPTLKKIFKKPQCIKGYCPVNYYYVENLITKEQILISNIVKFSRENNLHPSTLRQTLNNTRYHHKNFRLISLDDNKNNHKPPKWFIITPDNKELLINDLKQYCKENNLNYNNIKQIATNTKSIQHKGYRCYYYENVLNNNQQYPKCNFTFKVIDPNGNTYLTSSLIRLGEQLNINGKYLSHSYRNVINPLTDWKVSNI